MTRRMFSEGTREVAQVTDLRGEFCDLRPILDLEEIVWMQS